MYDFSGKVAVITGAGRQRGFGRATALQLARNGASVVVGDICRSLESAPGIPTASWDELRRVADEIKAFGREALAVKLDVTKTEEVQAMVSQVTERFGRIDILVNNAGVNTGLKPVVELTEAEWQLPFDVMCKGMFLCCKFVVPGMIERGAGGRIVNISSAAGKLGLANSAAYSAAKAAIIGFTQSLALELACHKINVNAVCPGAVETDMSSRTIEEYAKIMPKFKSVEDVKRTLVAKYPMRRFGTPDEIANMITYLASDQASFMTGQAINVTGGQTMS